MINKIVFSFSFTLLLLLAGPALASETVGTINASHAYAWGENIGWINLAPTNSSDEYVGLTITDSGLTGYGWSSKYGWINFQPSNSSQGVSNTTAGSLSGSAWVSGLGWLDLSGISIGENGVFAGTVGSTGSTVGRVTFDCDNCSVQTDWRPTSARTATGSGSEGGSGFIGGITNTVTTFSVSFRDLLLNLLNLIREKLRIRQGTIISPPETENISRNLESSTIAEESNSEIPIKINKNPENNLANQDNSAETVETTNFPTKKTLGVVAILLAVGITALWWLARVKYNK